MKKFAALGVALGMLLFAVAPAQATHHASRHHRHHTHVARVHSAPVAKRSTWAFADPAPSAPMLCTYMGGPKSTLWTCR